LSQEIEAGDTVIYIEGAPDRQFYTVLDVRNDRALCCPVHDYSELNLWIPTGGLLKVNR